VLAGIVSSVAVPAPAQENRIFWYTDYKEAIQEAKRTGKPLFLEFRCEA
jgi:uncharacterized protein YyaL (SSP411 family)